MSIKIRTRHERYPLAGGVLMTPSELMEQGIHA